MVIVYHGNVEAVKSELAKAEKTLHARYAAILGQERVRKVEEVAKRVLLPSSFFDSPSAVRDRLQRPFAEDESNKMFLFTSSDLKMDPSGVIKEKKVQTSVGFYISEAGFQETLSVSKVMGESLFLLLQHPEVLVEAKKFYNYTGY